MPAFAPDLRKFIVSNFLFGEEAGEFAFSDDDSFLERGIIDSTGILELVAFVEQCYGISVVDEDLVPENLDSVSCLARFVDRKLDAVAR